jgi:hypothetical protein
MQGVRHNIVSILVLLRDSCHESERDDHAIPTNNVDEGVSLRSTITLLSFTVDSSIYYHSGTNETLLSSAHNTSR